MSYHSENLVRQYGFEKGLDLLNVMAARHLGLISERHAMHFVRKNIGFFTGADEPPSIQDMQ